jgi:phosphatidylserine/phosphatidylglycerophosphate/cardiolipin synthase-like enzyme
MIDRMPRAAIQRAERERTRPGRRLAELRLLAGIEHYDELICRELPEARVALWIATANLKELRIEAPIGTRARARGAYMSVLELLGGLAERGVDVRILHGRPPSRAFSSELRARRGLAGKLALRECPRVHLKLVAVDGRSLYLGSANFTGAGLGARDPGRRNFELGILTDDEHLLDRSQALFDAIWSGRECKSCKLRRECPRPIDALISAGRGDGGRGR